MKLNLEETVTKGFFMEMYSIISGFSYQIKLLYNVLLEGLCEGPEVPLGAYER